MRTLWSRRALLALRALQTWVAFRTADVDPVGNDADQPGRAHVSAARGWRPYATCPGRNLQHTPQTVADDRKNRRPAVITIGTVCAIRAVSACGPWRTLHTLRTGSALEPLQTFRTLWPLRSTNVDRGRDIAYEAGRADILAARWRRPGAPCPRCDLQHAPRAVADDGEQRRPAVIAISTIGSVYASRTDRTLRTL